MPDHAWVKEFPCAITVCDANGIVLEMNDQAVRGYADQGGEKLVGANMLDCHPDHARPTAEHLLETQRPNVYTIEKKGVKKLIYQSPWYENGEFKGLVEVSLVIPWEMPHFVRDA
jgi:transcriptional regulator with PAS, ATPase and Fis domain